MIEPLTPMVAAKPENTCQTCTHYKPNSNTVVGWCTLNPPYAQLIPAKNQLGQDIMAPVSFFPTMSENEYCGQHKKRERYDA